jgi:small-conductance mechanosensitive channel
LNYSSGADFAVPAGILALCLLAGFLLQRYVSGKLHTLAKKTVSHWDDVLVRSLRGVVFIWSLLAGLSIILTLIPLPAAIYFFAKKAILLAAVVSVTIWAGRAAAGYADLYIVRIAGVSSSIFKTLALTIVYLVGFLIILDELGIAIAPIITALGVGGLAVALSLQDTLANLFAGLHILMSRNVRPGDYIKLSSGEEGYVLDITWRNTTLRELENNLVIIPNKKLAESILRNYSLPEAAMAVLVDFKLAYGADLKAAEKMIVEEARAVLETTPGAAADFVPFVRFNILGDRNIGGTTILRVTEFTEQYLVKSEFIRRMRERFFREGIADPFPITSVRIERSD